MGPVGRFMLVGLALLPSPAGWSAEDPKDLVVIPQSAQSFLRARDEKVTLKSAAFFLAEWDRKHQQDMVALGLTFEVILADVRADDTLYLFELHDGEEPPPDWRTLYRHGRDAIVLIDDADAERQSRLGQHVVRLWHEPRG